MNIDIKKISELNEAIYNDNLLFLVEDQDGKGKKLKGVNFKEELKSDLVDKASMLSYEEIMASTPPIDLDIGIPKASALKNLIKVQVFTGTTDSNGRIEKYFNKEIFINAFCIYPVFGCIRYIANYNNPGLFYFYNASSNSVLANNEVKYTVITLGDYL